VTLAPIGVSVYNRLEHFQKCIYALQHNELASRSTLIIYSDGPANEENVEVVRLVREFAHAITGFKLVKIVERPGNMGGVGNGDQGCQQITRDYGKSIFVEDDQLAAPGFLTFMNAALDRYEHDDRVISICGYAPPISVPADLESDIFCMDRFGPWGCGLYPRTLELLYKDIDPDEFHAIADKYVLCRFGDDVYEMSERVVAGCLDAADVRCMYHQALSRQTTIYPRKSLIQNIGFDGTGIHCGITNRFDHDALWDKTEGFSFPLELSVDERIRRANYLFRSPGGKFVDRASENLIDWSVVKQHALKNVDSVFQQSYAQHVGSRRFESGANSPSYKIALISTPRVGSSLFSDALTMIAGKACYFEWLHTRYVACYESNNNGGFDPEQYLNDLYRTTFEKTGVFALNFHVSQYMYWLKHYQIDVLDFFGFDRIYYLDRRDIFAQSYSLAVATLSGLWDSTVEEAVVLPEGSKIIIDKSQLLESYKSITTQLNAFTKYLSKRVDYTFSSEDIMGQGVAHGLTHIIKDIGLGSKKQYQDSSYSSQLSRQTKFICPQNKNDLRLWFKQKFG